MTNATGLRRFREAYAAHRAAEGRGAGGAAEFLALPYLREGPHARTWNVRARTYDRFVDRIVGPAAASVAPRPLRVLDLGAGNGWLSRRMALLGHDAVALDLRDDAVDGLGAAPADAIAFARVVASFDAVPLRSAEFDLVVYNASIHYVADLGRTLRHAVQVLRRGGRIAILDSPFYDDDSHGRRMIAEKRATADACFGERASDLLDIGSIEYLTRESLQRASAPLHLSWRRHRVRYPLWYEFRPLRALLRGGRPPSRFDLWEAWLT